MGEGKQKRVENGEAMIVVIPKETKNRLKMQAISDDVTMSELVRMIIEGYLDSIRDIEEDVEI